MSKLRTSLGLAVAVPILLTGLLTVGYEVWYLSALDRSGPVVGVSTDQAWHARAGLTTTSYEIALTRAGGRAFMFRAGELPPDEILDRIDALLLAGGGDVDPAIYGERDVDADLTNLARDQFELELIRGAVARDMPILAICRGVQILNVAHGGTLTTIRHDPEKSRLHGSKLTYLDHTHSVTVAAHSRLAGIVGSGTKEVDSYHGQAIARVGRGLEPVATAPDGTVEALERRDRSFVLALQWHPELLSLSDSNELRPFTALVEAARHYAAARTAPKASTDDHAQRLSRWQPWDSRDPATGER